MQSGYWACLITLLLCIIIGSSGQAKPETKVSQRGEVWLLENERLKVELDAQTGKVSVLDKLAKYLWQQPGVPKGVSAARPIKILRARQPIVIDGDLSDKSWSEAVPIVLTYDMVCDAEAKEVKDNRDCSAVAYCLWDDKYLYLAVKVVDEDLRFAAPGTVDWWEADAIEFWVGSMQIGLGLFPEKSVAFRGARELLEGCEVVVKPDSKVGSGKDMELIGKQKGIDVKGAPGYVVEGAFPLTLFPDLREARPGQQFKFAVGVDDADATGRREGQIYFPRTWEHSAPDTFATAILADEKGEVPAGVAGAPEPKIKNIKPLRGKEPGIQYETEVALPGGRILPLQVKLIVPDKSADLKLQLDTPDRETEISNFSFFDSFVLDTPEGFLAVADYSDGHIYLLSDLSLQGRWWGTDRLDMPWVALTDLRKGYGYLLLVETPDDGFIRLKRANINENTLLVPELGFLATKGRFGYPRKIVCHFSSEGGYVALAKWYRNYAKSSGILVTLKEKRKKNKNIDKLLGASDIWGADGLRFCQEAKAAGIDRGIINGRWSAEAMKEINRLGFLTSEYDNYTDILPLEPGKTISSNNAPIPEHVVKNWDGSLMKAWLTWDKKTQYMKRCPALALEAAKIVVPPILKNHPFEGRFNDVMTAEGLYECYDPNHPQTRGESRESKYRVLEYFRSFGLVVGGEHGIYWAVPVLDYQEGMMSGGYASWPAGHLIRPKSKEEISEAYLKYGLGHYHRVPLWELVFHDCVVSYWYWGDTTDFLHEVAPELTDKKDLFNILYGTPPHFWAQYFDKYQERCLQSYRNVCKLHEQVGYDEMISHEFLTEDHTVQRTRFAPSGLATKPSSHLITEVTVNFGDKPYQIKDSGKIYLLGQNGFFVRGPKILQYHILKEGKPVTYIQTPNYLFADGHGKFQDFGAVGTSSSVTIKKLGKEKLNLLLSGSDKILVRPSRIVKNWDLRSTKLIALSEKGERQCQVTFRQIDKQTLEFKPLAEVQSYELICGKETQFPDLVIGPQDVSVSNRQPRQGEIVIVKAKVKNEGRKAVREAAVSLELSGWKPEWPYSMKARYISLPPGSSKEVEVKFHTEPLDGFHRVTVFALPPKGVKDLIPANNLAQVELHITIDPSKWQYRLPVIVESGELARQDEPVVLPVNFTEELKNLDIRGSLDPDSVRVIETDEIGNFKASVPAQFDKSDDFHNKTNARGEVIWILTGETPAGTKRHFQVLFDTLAFSKGKKLLPLATLWDEKTKTVSTEGYRAEFEEGVISRLFNNLGSQPKKSLLSGLVLSSGQTGWVKEQGKVDSITLKHQGLVRATIVVKKTLTGEVTYEKTYYFYPHRFDLEISVNKPIGGLYSRAYYSQPAQYEDDKGYKATIDGQGDAEEIYGKNRDPKWYAVYTPEWSHSCIALSKFDHIAYWDTGGAWGGVGLVTGDLSGVRMSYVFHPGQSDAKFAQADYERLTNPPKVTKLTVRK